jgi:uncharacterized protein with gpF-like domain
MKWATKLKAESYFLKWERKIRTLLKAEYKRAIDRYTTDGEAAINGIFPGNDLTIYLTDLYSEVGLRFGRDAFFGTQKAAKKDAFGDFALEQILQYIRLYAGTKIASISGTAKDEMLAEIEKAQQEGGSPADIARRALKALTVASFYQGIRIARTEVIAAANFGALEGARAAGVMTQKAWQSANQRRTRDAHRAANGQRVGINENFTVMGEAMRYPGDPKGSSKNVINCRCTMLFSDDND